ncbi:reticulon protein [Salix suchowensis]|nr:reticulon protein [Salix suchowensis]
MDDPMDGFDSQLLKEIEDHDNYENFDSSSEREIDEYIMLHSTQRITSLDARSLFTWFSAVKNISARILAIVTVIWFLFECLGYHLLTFVCHSLTLSLATVFLWSNLASYINVSPPKLPDVILPDELFVSFLLLLRSIINRAFTPFQEVASGKDLKKFLKVIVVLWVLSVIGSWFSFLTFLYPLFLMLMTLPKLYERNEDAVDIYAAKWWFEVMKQFAVLNEYVLKKIPIFGSQKYHTQH